MIANTRNIIIISILLHLPIIWTKIAYYDHNTVPASGNNLMTRAPVDGVDAVDAVISDVEMLEVLTREVGTTFTVSCIRDKDGLIMKTMTCGAGTMCSKERCEL